MTRHPQSILVLDFGSQVTQLIARRVREAKVYCEIHPYNLSLKKIKEMNPKGVILSGGPASVHAKGSPKPDKGVFDLGVPVLGICYGMQLMGQMLGGKVRPAKAREYGLAELVVDGISTTIPIHQEILSHSAFAESRVDTSFVERTLLAG